MVIVTVATSIIDVCRRSSGTCRIVSVGSGPAVDVQRALEKLTKAEQARLHITLVDIDPAALDHARERLTPHVSEEQLQLVRENLYRFHHGPRAAESLNGADLIFCTGLFDYLDEAAATDMLATFWNRLAASGLLLVFNFSAQNPSRTFMEWIGNWYLIYRDKNQMAELAARAGMTTSQFKIDAESLGIDLFIRADKQ